MAVEASSPTVRLRLAQQRLTRLRRNLVAYIADAAAGDIGFDRTVRGLMPVLKGDRDKLVDARNVPNIGTVAAAESETVNYDFVAEVDAVVALLNAAMDEIVAATPTNGTWILAVRYVGYDLVERTGTPAQTANIRAALQAVVDAISV